MKLVVWKTLLMVLCTWYPMVHAQTMTKEESKRIWDAAVNGQIAGPAQIPLKTEGKVHALLTLPGQQAYIGQPHAGKVLSTLSGNTPQDEHLLGLVLPDKHASWHMVIRFVPSGFVKDAQAKDWNPEDLLASYIEHHTPTQRAPEAAPANDVLEWVQKPSYNKETHRLEWALSSRPKGSAELELQTIHHHTFVLGREGYFSLTLVTALNTLAANLAASQVLRESLQFRLGRRYVDFDATTDSVAPYGVESLVVGLPPTPRTAAVTVAGFIETYWKFALIVLSAAAYFLYKRYQARKAAETLAFNDSNFANTLIVESTHASPPPKPAAANPSLPDTMPSKLPHKPPL